MRALIQRVERASVALDGVTIGAIDMGILILICAMAGDTQENVDKMARKIAKLRIFKDDDGRMNRSLLDVDGCALIVSQFTLAADTRRGNRPGFSTAAAPQDGRVLYEAFVKAMMDQDIHVATGEYGADMNVQLINQGPVTIWLDDCD